MRIDETGGRGANQNSSFAEPYLQPRRRDEHDRHSPGQRERRFMLKARPGSAFLRFAVLERAHRENGAVDRGGASSGEQCGG